VGSSWAHLKDAKQASVVAKNHLKPGFVRSCNAPWDDQILAGVQTPLVAHDG